MATSETNPVFCVKGTIPHPRPRPRKVTNSEKTSTTNNLSQHKYLKLKRPLKDETDNTLISTGDTEFQNPNRPLKSVVITRQDKTGQRRASNPASYNNMQHQYKLVSDWDSQWHTLYNHFTTYHQHRYLPSSCQGSAVRAATSHLQPESSDLPKLLTSTRLSLQVPPNQQNTALCNYPQNPPCTDSSTMSASNDDEFEDPPCYDDQSMDVTPGGNFDSCSNNINCTSHYLPMTCTDSLIMSRVYMSSADRGTSTTTAGTRRTSWYSEYLSSTLQRMHARSRNERRKKTKSAPGGSVSLLTTEESKKRRELFTSTTITYFSAHRDVKRLSREHGAVDFDVLKAEKAKEVLSKPPPLYKPDPKPRSHWYEMRTPDFHREAKRNNILIRKSCNW